MKVSFEGVGEQVLSFEKASGTEKGVFVKVSANNTVAACAAAVRAACLQPPAGQPASPPGRRRAAPGADAAARRRGAWRAVQRLDFRPAASRQRRGDALASPAVVRPRQQERQSARWPGLAEL